MLMLDKNGRYWSSKQEGDKAYCLYYFRDYGMHMSTSRVNLGLQIRCVK
jgi:hypothetical protein